MKLDKLKNKVSHLVANGRLDLALNLISENDNSFEFSKSNQVIGLMGRLNSLNRDDRSGLITPQQSNMRRNQISHAILSLCDIREEIASINTKTKNTAVPVFEPKVSFKKIKSVLKGIRGDDNAINYYEAVDAIADLF